MRRTLLGLAIAALAAGSTFAQYVISAHSGVVQVVEGSAYLDDKAVETKFGHFPDLKNGQELRTAEGRAEVLLTPGVFLRMGENSAIKMVSNALTDTRVEVLSGSAIVECDEIPKDNSIMLQYKDNSMMLVKHGLYRIDSQTSTFRVYDGEAIVKAQSGQVTLKAGKETALNGALMAANFDKKTTDDLYNWSSRRAGYLATANASSAMALRNSGGYTSSGWQFNPMFGMFTYVPYTGFGYSPFGFGWFSPYSIGYYYPTYGGGYFGGGSGSTFGHAPAQLGTASSARGANLGFGGFSRGGFGSGPSSAVSGIGGGGMGGGGGMASGGGMSGGGGGHAGGGGHR